MLDFAPPPHSQILLAKLRLWSEEYLRLEKTTSVIRDKGIWQSNRQYRYKVTL